MCVWGGAVIFNSVWNPAVILKSEWVPATVKRFRWVLHCGLITEMKLLHEKTPFIVTIKSFM